MKGSRRLWASLAVAVAAAALVVGSRRPYLHWAAGHWRDELQTAGDEDAPSMLRQVAALGEPGIPVLVEAIGSPRHGVATAARQVLAEQLDQWKSLGVGERSTRLAALADALAEHVDQFGPAGRREALELATRVLRWPLDAKAVDRIRVIAACEEVVRKATDADGLSAQTVWSESLDAALRPNRTSQAADATLSPLEGPPLAGGGLPIPAIASDEEPLRFGEDQALTSLPLQPLRNPGSGEGLSPGPGNPLRHYGTTDEPQRLSVRPNEARALDRAAVPRGEALAPAESGSIRELSHVESEPEVPIFAEVDAAELEIVEWMRSLRSPDAAAADRARQELTRRGFGPVQLELARQLFDPDPEVRKRLARVLPGMQSVDAVPWLMWLGRDADAEVRRAAITLLATTGDPNLLVQIEQMARQDPDPEIRRLGDRIGQRPQHGRE